MIDILYGEEIHPRVGFEFFAHIGECDRCRGEYLELIETREMLAGWEPEEVDSDVAWSPGSKDVSRRGLIVGWWPLLQKLAAAVLITVGALSVFQSIGVFPASGKAATISEAQLTEVIHDVTLARQVEDWRVIGEALLELKEELEARNQMQLRTVYEDLQTLEQRYVNALEESNRQVRMLIDR